MLACTLEVDEAEVLKAVSLYTNALMLLDQYDHQSLKSLLEARLSIELHMKIAEIW